MSKLTVKEEKYFGFLSKMLFLDTIRRFINQLRYIFKMNPSYVYVCKMSSL